MSSSSHPRQTRFDLESPARCPHTLLSFLLSKCRQHPSQRDQPTGTNKLHIQHLQSTKLATSLGPSIHFRRCHSPFQKFPPLSFLVLVSVDVGYNDTISSGLKSVSFPISQYPLVRTPLFLLPTSSDCIGSPMVVKIEVKKKRIPVVIVIASHRVRNL